MDPIIDEWQTLREQDEDYQTQRHCMFLQQPPPINIQDFHYKMYPPLASFLADSQKFDQLQKALVKKPKTNTNKYFITFTYNNNSTKDSFKAAVLKQINRKTFTDYTYSFEHEDTNIHCHAILTTPHTINQSNFKSHVRKFGHVDIRKISIDNGLEEYISKESKPISKNNNLDVKQNALQT